MFQPQQAGAQAPEKMSYQAVIRNSSDALVTNTTIGMQISILQGSATGTAVYVETQAPTTNANGLVSIEIGGTNATVISGNFSTIDWTNDSYFIKTETGLAGGTTYSITGTSQLLSIPYALHAKTAETYTETDPAFGASVASGITGTDTTNWNNKQDQLIVVGQLMGTNGEDGIVVYVDHTGQHGLICSKTDINGGSEVAWSSVTNVTVPGGALSQFNGSANTTAINNQSTTSAANLCLTYSTPGTSAGDWYLPSIDELSEIYHAKYEINKALNVNSFELYDYWSSTENNNNTAWCYEIHYGYSYGEGKNSTCHVRAVRAF